MGRNPLQIGSLIPTTRVDTREQLFFCRNPLQIGSLIPTRHQLPDTIIPDSKSQSPSNRVTDSYEADEMNDIPITLRRNPLQIGSLIPTRPRGRGPVHHLFTGWSQSPSNRVTDSYWMEKKTRSHYWISRNPLQIGSLIPTRHYREHI